ncbi:MAG: hypothetical protein AAF519_03280 [Bacteroidota bacterium]
MLAFFRLNDPYRLLVIFLLLLAVRLPALIGNYDTSVQELNFMLVGEKMAAGASMYSEIWETTSPLAAAIFGIIDFLFGRSQTAYLLIAWLFVCVQVFLFNRLVLVNKVYNENTYVPGLVYGVLASLHADFFTLTPMLMSVTFVLPALNNIFRHIEIRAKRDEQILYIGLYMGLAYLFYLPMIVFSVGVLLVFILFTGTVTRRYIMLIYGLLVPMIMTSFYYLLLGRWQDFIVSALQPLFKGQLHSYVSYKFLLVILAVPTLFLVMSFFKMAVAGRFNNFQARLNQSTFVFLVFAVFTVILNDLSAPNAFYVLVPFLSYYLSHFFLLIKRRFFAEIGFAAFIVALIVSNYGGIFTIIDLKDKSYAQEYYLEDREYLQYKDKKIVVFGDNLKPYQYAKSATPFLNWKIAKEVLQRPDYYDNLTLILKGFKQDMPEIIIDYNSVMPSLRERILPLKEGYQLKSAGIYEKTNS